MPNIKKSKPLPHRLSSGQNQRLVVGLRFRERPAFCNRPQLIVGKRAVSLADEVVHQWLELVLIRVNLSFGLLVVALPRWPLELQARANGI